MTEDRVSMTETTPTPPAENPGRTPQVVASAFLIVVAAAVAFSNTFTIPTIQTGPAPAETPSALWMQRISGEPVAMPAPEPARQPVTWLSFQLAGALPGDVSQRAVNFLAHLAGAVLVYLVCRRLFGERLPEPAAMAAGLLFALHPAVTGAMNDLAARGTVLATLFMLAALLVFLRGCARDAGFRPPSMVAAGVLFALAWGSSSLAAALPPLLLAADWVANGRNLRQRASIHAGAWALLASFALVRTASGAIPSSVPASLGAQAAALVENAGILLTGRGLSAVHPQPASGGVAELALVTLAGLAALVLLARRSVAGFALAWGLIVLSASTWTPSGQPLLSDVRLYPAAVAAGLLLTAGYAALAPYPAARYAAAAAVTILIVAAGVGAFSRNTLWNQPARLWLDAVAQTPRSALANLRAGEAQLLEAERLLAELAATGDGLDTQTISVRRQRVAELAAEARPYLETAAALDEESAEARYLLGVSLALQNARDEALAAFKDALARSLGDYGATLEIARLYQARASESGSLEDTRRALDYFQRAARLAPGRPDHVAGLGLALASLGDWLGARAALAPVMPESADEVSASPLAQRYAEIRAMAAQVETLQEQARQRLGGERVPTDVLRIQAQRRFLERNYLPAAYLLDRYLAEVPGDAVGWALLGAARARIGSADRFLAEYPPPTVAAGQPSPWLQLATFCAMDGAWGDARNYLTSPVARQTLPMPLMALAETALGLQQLDRATALLREATETHPDAPDPWLRLADIAIATNEQAAARGYLDQAAARGAADTALDPRRERLGDPDEAPEVPRVLLR